MISPTDLPEGVVGRSYSADLDSAGGAAWRVVGGRLPGGLSLSASSGELSGRPTESGEFSFRVRAELGTLSRRVGEQSFSLTIRDALTLNFALPPARVDVPYQFSPDITGGLPPYSVLIIGLPAGMTFEGASGVITGTPLLVRDGLPLQINVTDSAVPPQSLTKDGELEVQPRAVAIVTSVLDSARVGSSYTARLSAVDGRAPYSWSVIDGVLPGGLALNRSTGVISGTPNAAGQSTFRVRVEDDDDPQSEDERELTLVVAVDPVAISTGSLPDAMLNVAYNAALAAMGGAPPYGWSVRSGILPAGLSLDPTTGVLSGTPTVTGMLDVTIEALDSGTPATRGSKTLTIRVLAGP